MPLRVTVELLRAFKGGRVHSRRRRQRDSLLHAGHHQPS